MAPERRIPSSETKTYRSAEPSVAGRGIKDFLRMSLKVMVKLSPFYHWIPAPVHLGSGRNSTIYWTQIQSIYCLLKNAGPDFLAAPFK